MAKAFLRKIYGKQTSYYYSNRICYFRDYVSNSSIFDSKSMTREEKLELALVQAAIPIEAFLLTESLNPGFFSETALKELLSAKKYIKRGSAK